MANWEGNKVICRNCGFQNEAGDEFCGSCGKYLDWSGEGAQGTPAGAEEATTVAPVFTNQPIPEGPRAGQNDSLTTTPPIMARPQPQPSGRDPDVICWNCGKRNPGGRTFCLQCGEKLTAGVRTSRVGDSRTQPVYTDGDDSNRRRAVAIGAAIIVLLLIAAIGVATFLGGGGPDATPTPPISAVASASPTAAATTGASPSAGAVPSAGPTLPAIPTGPLDTPLPTTATTPQPTRTAGPPATPKPPQIVLFRRENYTGDKRNVVDCTDPDYDGTIYLGWELRGATGAELSIDGPGVYKSYSGKTGNEPDAPFSCGGDPTHTYTLTTTGGNGPPDSITRTIRRGTPEILDWSIQQDVSCAGNLSVPVYVTWNIAYATGIELWVDGALFATYSGKHNTGYAGDINCFGAERTYRLVTTGGYGDAASDTRTFTAQ